MQDEDKQIKNTTQYVLDISNPDVCRRAHVLITLFVFACTQWCPAHILLCFYVICLRLVYPMLSVYLDYPFLIAPSVFSNVYLKKQELPTIRQHLGLPPSFLYFGGAALLQCQSSVLCFFVFIVLYLLCLVPNVDCVSGLIIFRCPFGFL